MEKWRQRVALVTGAGKGIGAAISKDLANHGVKVIGCDRNIDSVESVAKEISPSGVLFPIKCDLRNESDIMDMFQQIKEEHGGVDICVCNAGVAHLNTSILEGDTSKWRDMVDVNLMAYAICAREAAKQMQSKGTDDGFIIFINSGAGHAVHANRTDFSFYSITKFGVNAMAKSLKYELEEKKSHIRVTQISPGIVQTDFTHTMHANIPADDVNQKYYNNRLVLQAKDVSEMVLHALAAPRHVHVDDIHMNAPPFI